MLVSLATDKTSAAQSAFSSIMAEKINDALDERKVAIASQLYNSQSEQ